MSSMERELMPGSGLLKKTNELINYFAGIEQWEWNTYVQCVKDHLKPTFH